MVSDSKPLLLTFLMENTLLKKTLLLALTMCAAATLAISQPVYAQISEFKLTASDGAADDQFGNSVSISGDYAIVGARFNDDNGLSSGSAYIFKRTGTSWAQEAKLLPSDGAEFDFFGVSVSISGDYAVVGAQGDDDNATNAGSAYIFKRTGTTWAEEAKLLPSDGAAQDQFGWSVSISGDYAVVGVQDDDDNGSASGSAYVFKRTGTSWAQEAKLLPSDGAELDLFGTSVSISGDYAIVGALLDDDNGNASGSAYVFKRTGTSWAEEAKLLSSDGAGSDVFGTSVSISGDYAVVGARLNDENGQDAGSAYVFKRTGTSWAEEAKLLPSDAAQDDQFGFSVSISGDYTVIGASLDDDNGNASGSAYLFKRTGTSWAEEAKLLSSDGAAGDVFGTSVSISGDYAVVGAFRDDDNGTDAGSAYLYNLSPAASISLSPSPLNFGDVNSGNTLSMQLSISNSGDAALDVTNITSSDNQFTVASPTSFQVAAGTSINKTVTFAPTTTGVKSGTLTVTSNASNLPSATVDLSGTGTSSSTAVISLSPSPLNFGDVLINTTKTLELSITNGGDTALDVTNITSSNSQFTVASPTSFQVAAGASINKTVTFTPSSEG
ncbi:MAG: choice-of-anchor D domain-containing protein, partial [Candidatus Marinimicrobia bacterium]|nr:choice-of-anchor D domain-containing protein [Candidatus Neomarinimicrobiota bacterium]